MLSWQRRLWRTSNARTMPTRWASRCAVASTRSPWRSAHHCTLPVGQAMAPVVELGLGLGLGLGLELEQGMKLLTSEKPMTSHGSAHKPKT